MYEFIGKNPTFQIDNMLTLLALVQYREIAVVLL